MTKLSEHAFRCEAKFIALLRIPTFFVGDPNFAHERSLRVAAKFRAPPKAGPFELLENGF